MRKVAMLMAVVLVFSCVAVNASEQETPTGAKWEPVVVGVWQRSITRSTLVPPKLAITRPRHVSRPRTMQPIRKPPGTTRVLRRPAPIVEYTPPKLTTRSTNEQMIVGTVTNKSSNSSSQSQKADSPGQTSSPRGFSGMVVLRGPQGKTMTLQADTGVELAKQLKELQKKGLIDAEVLEKVRKGIISAGKAVRAQSGTSRTAMAFSGPDGKTVTVRATGAQDLASQLDKLKEKGLVEAEVVELLKAGLLGKALAAAGDKMPGKVIVQQGKGGASVRVQTVDGKTTGTVTIIGPDGKATTIPFEGENIPEVRASISVQTIDGKTTGKITVTGLDGKKTTIPFEGEEIPPEAIEKIKEAFQPQE